MRSCFLAAVLQYNSSSEIDRNAVVYMSGFGEIDALCIVLSVCSLTQFVLHLALLQMLGQGRYPQHHMSYLDLNRSRLNKLELELEQEPCPNPDAASPAGQR